MADCPAEGQQKASTKLHIGLVSGLAPDCPEWRGREKPYYRLFGCNVVLPIDNLIKKRRKT